MLEPPPQGGSNEYPQCMFWIKNKKNRYSPANPSFSYIKVGFKRVYILQSCNPDGLFFFNFNVQGTSFPYFNVDLQILDIYTFDTVITKE